MTSILYAAGRASSFAVRSGQTPRGRREIYHHRVVGSRRGAVLALVSLLPLAACDVEWGGATLAFVNPAPAPEPSEEPSPDEELVEPLPEGDLLYLVRLTGAGGGAEAVPIARLTGGAPAALGIPERIRESYRVRFDSAFYAAGTELPLHAGGHRVGTLIFDGGTGSTGADCLSVGSGRIMLLPGADQPEHAFAWAGEGAAGSPITYDLSDTDTRMRTYGPVLAENLLRRGGENRPQLAQRVAMRAVPWPGDERPAMAATYLVNDDLGDEPPRRGASSLFFLARFDGRQYVPEWWEVRRYDGAEGREAFMYFGAIAGPDGRVDFVTRHEGARVSLAASVDREGEDRGIDWTEAAGCPALSLLGAGPISPDDGG